MSIRYAVGAIVRYGEDILLVRKVKMMMAQRGPEDIDPIWDFPKGGINSNEDVSVAILRELQEETGSRQYRIIQKLPDFVFQFSEEVANKLGFLQQITSMFEVEYVGDGLDLFPQDEEIDRIQFFSIKDAVEYVTYANSQEYLQNVLNCKSSTR